MNKPNTKYTLGNTFYFLSILHFIYILFILYSIANPFNHSSIAIIVAISLVRVESFTENIYRYAACIRMSGRPLKVYIFLISLI